MSSNNSSRAPNLSLQTKFSCNQVSCSYYSANENSACGGKDCRSEAATWYAFEVAHNSSDANVSDQATDGTREPPPTPAPGGK
ncbi:hypothetical protein V865_008090 [Kwoniella europaea PYCC6329]|uniref:Uncharacterized protein n=1 Tax=Kwoniella europaea PYCC6329 TaxID=1423913 RepID=A0AAX4KV44_9TREE